jgi:hypothetical protein
MERNLSPLETQAADALRRARQLPVGPSRNDLRQLAIGLLWLHRNGMEALERERARSSQILSSPQPKSANDSCPGAEQISRLSGLLPNYF